MQETLSDAHSSPQMPLEREPLGRLHHQLRPWSLETQVNRYAEGSALIRAGYTQVLCTVSIEESVPGWLRGKGQGWVSAEYAMLPRATHTRSKRDREKVSGRTQEIQRLIARSLRQVVDLTQLGERSLVVDCDVLQADGGTRTASISGGCVALSLALAQLIAQEKVPPSVWRGVVSAVSVGLKNQQVWVDLDYQEDSSCDVDMNFVMNQQQHFLEIQGTSERQAFSQADLSQMIAYAQPALAEIQSLQIRTLKNLGLPLAF